MLMASERYRLTRQTSNLPITQRLTTYQTWVTFLPPESQAIQNQFLIDTERGCLILQTSNLSIAERLTRYQAWIDSLPQASQAGQGRILRRNIHEQQMRTIIQEQQLGIDIPDIGVPDENRTEWSSFATDLIVEYEDEHGLGSSRVLGDILQGGTQEAASWNEIRNSQEYKDLITWVLKRWHDHIRAQACNNV